MPHSSVPHKNNKIPNIRSDILNIQTNLPNMESVDQNGQSITSSGTEEPPIRSNPIKILNQKKSPTQQRSVSSLSMMMRGINDQYDRNSNSGIETSPNKDFPESNSPSDDILKSQDNIEFGSLKTNTLSSSFSINPISSSVPKTIPSVKQNGSIMNAKLFYENEKMDSNPRNQTGSSIIHLNQKDLYSNRTSLISINDTLNLSSIGVYSNQNNLRKLIAFVDGNKEIRLKPLYLSTFIPYYEKKESSDEDTSSSTITPMSAISAFGSDSYEDISNRKYFSDNSDKLNDYDPLFLDDPEIRTSRKKKVMAMKGILTSTIPFIKLNDMNKDLDDQFKQKHQSWLNKKLELTLSMIRQMKRSMISILETTTIVEVTTVAIAIVHFEKLILQNQVSKTNCKLIAATCLFIAFKLNDESGGSKRKSHMETFFDRIDHEFGISRKSLIQKEFALLSLLKFDINPSKEQWIPHIEYIQRESSGDLESWCHSIITNSKID